MNNTYPQPHKDNTDKFATAGFVLGLCSIVAWLLPLLGYPVTIVGLVMSIKGLKGTRKGFCITGIVLSAIFLIVTILNSILGAAMNVSKLM